MASFVVCCRPLLGGGIVSYFTADFTMTPIAALMAEGREGQERITSASSGSCVSDWVSCS